ncbi:anaphase-promoting complex subunit 15 isoform X1 [Rhipicephalus microplus]|uniref:Putative transcription factor iia n=1 Tax=Rhipicephalus microplus TaxID=6941 RepID=A0A6G5ACT9_RHIMP|nr:anaphase-promoting complex subunit 15-like isoform X1 [Rhipicephalus microplus]
MEAPQFPSLQPKIADQSWFYVDRPCDDESELTQLEKEHQSALTSIAQTHNDLVPIGKTAAELQDEDEEDDEDDDNEDDESDSNEDEDDELDADDINYDQDSPMFH